MHSPCHRSKDAKLNQEDVVKVVVTGATGFIGRALVRALLERGDEVIALTRNPEKARDTLSDRVASLRWVPGEPGEWMMAFNGAGAVVNLAGESVAGGRWTQAKKDRIYRSRVEATRSVVEAIREANPAPAVLVNASAVGYYGPRGDEVLTEESGPGTDFLAQVVEGWEAAANAAHDLGVRVVTIRTGIVLGRGGGALQQMAMPFRLFVGGTMGEPGQWVPWIDLEDEVGLILYAIDTPTLHGPVNATAPSPVTMDVLSRQIGAALHRPTWVPFLGRGLRMGLGEAGDSITASQRVLPTRAQEAGYTFRHTDSADSIRRALSS